LLITWTCWLPRCKERRNRSTSFQPETKKLEKSIKNTKKHLFNLKQKKCFFNQKNGFIKLDYQVQ
jgi:hypothetical protein